MKETIIKQDVICVGSNVRRIRLERKIGQTELVRLMQLKGIDMYREALVKIERGTQHITASQLKGFKECLNTTFEELLR